MKRLEEVKNGGAEGGGQEEAGEELVQVGWCERVRRKLVRS